MNTSLFGLALTGFQVLSSLLDLALVGAAVWVVVACARRGVASSTPAFLLAGTAAAAVLGAIDNWFLYQPWGFELLGQQGIRLAALFSNLLGLGAAGLVAVAIAAFPRLPAAGGDRG